MDFSRLPGEPFTVEHFVAWAALLKLDSGEYWTPDEFQIRFVRDLFSGIPEIWLLVPEGNGKSTLIAALALYHIQFREDARVPVAASSRDQAGIIYRQASGFVLRNKLDHVFRCLKGHRRIECEATRSVIQLHAADAGTADGEIFTMGVVDELHRQDLELYRTWNGKLDKREGQLVVISTAGVPGGEFETERELLRQTADEITMEGRCFIRAASETTILHEYAVPEDGDVEDLELVAEANPRAGITAAQLAAKRKRIRHLGHWKRFTCNLATRSDEAAISEQEWFGAQVSLEIPDGEEIWLGIDLGWKIDTTAIVPLWIRDNSFRLFGTPTIIAPPGDGTMTSPAKVQDALRKYVTRYKVRMVVMDMSDGATIAAWLEDEFGITVVDRGQQNQYQVLDYERFTEAMREGWIHHTGDPTFTRHVLNAHARMLPGGDLRFDRPHANRKSRFQDERVIDALVAAAMVHTTATAGDTSKPFFL